MNYFTSCFEWLVIIFAVVSISIISAIENAAVLAFNIGSVPPTPEIHLDKFLHLTTTVQLYRNETSYGNRFENFIVEAPKKHQVMVFVRALHLTVSWKEAASISSRESEEQITFSNVPQCNEFLQFRTLKSHLELPKVCGEVDGNDTSLLPPGLVGSRIFHEPAKILNVSLHMGDSYNYVRGSRTKMLAELVFTAYSECGNGGLERKRCSKSAFSCIQSHLFCDDKIHCAFRDGFGADEKNCAGYAQSAPTKNSGEVEVLSGKENTDDKIRRYFIPTGLILFFCWGIITMIRKCYRCYIDENEKEDLYI